VIELKLETKFVKDWNGVGIHKREFYKDGKMIGFYTVANKVVGLRGFGIEGVVALREKDFFNHSWIEIHDFLKEHMGEAYDFRVAKELISWMIKDLGHEECPLCGMPVVEEEFKKYKAHWSCWREKHDLTSPLFP